MVPHFAGICLVTDDVPRLAAFYAEVLGAPAEGNDPHMEVRTEGAGLAIFSSQSMENMAPGSMRGSGHGSVTLMFRVADVDAEYERLAPLGLDYVKPTQTHPWGSRSFWFRDPDGNIVDFYTPPTS